MKMNNLIRKPILTFGFVLSVTTGCLTANVLPSSISP